MFLFQPLSLASRFYSGGDVSGNVTFSVVNHWLWGLMMIIVHDMNWKRFDDFEAVGNMWELTDSQKSIQAKFFIDNFILSVFNRIFEFPLV